MKMKVNMNLKEMSMKMKTVTERNTCGVAPRLYAR